MILLLTEEQSYKPQVKRKTVVQIDEKVLEEPDLAKKLLVFAFYL